MIVSGKEHSIRCNIVQNIGDDNRTIKKYKILDALTIIFCMGSVCSSDTKNRIKESNTRLDKK